MTFGPLTVISPRPVSGLTLSSRICTPCVPGPVVPTWVLKGLAAQTSGAVSVSPEPRPEGERARGREGRGHQELVVLRAVK